MINRRLQTLNKLIKDGKVDPNYVGQEIVSIIASIRLSEVFKYETKMNIYEKVA